jgi:hypothetical protein
MAGDKIDLFEMANLSPRLTGPRKGGPGVGTWMRPPRDPNQGSHGAWRQISISNTATVAVDLTRRLIAGQLSAVDM